jgi:hypothetical protein
MPFLIIGILALAVYLMSSSSSASAETNTGASMYKSDGSITGSPITSDQGTWPSGDQLWQIAQAIALAEGYNRGSGYVPYDLNNPGDISDGAATYGSQPHSGSNVTTFPTAEIGWQWLYNKLNTISTGGSSVYQPTMTWQQIAALWAGDSGAWVNNVTSNLGVDPTSAFEDYLT